jgi:hypothetical protein
MPEVNVPFDATIFQLVVTYYQLDKAEKADKLAKRLFEIFEADMKFYINLGPKAGGYSREVRQAQEVMYRLTSLAKANKRDALAKDFETRYMVFARLSNPQQQQQQQQFQPQPQPDQSQPDQQ